MKIITKFNVGDKLYKVINASIKEIEIVNINIIVSEVCDSKLPNIAINYICCGTYDDLSQTFPERVLEESWFGTPEKAAQNLLDNFYKN